MPNQLRIGESDASAVPLNPKIYHIVHVDRLSSITSDRWLWSDSEIVRRASQSDGTSIGISDIKKWRRRAMLPSYPDLHVGDCVPFYFCPRSVMLYVLHKSNHPSLTYDGGQEPIVHLEADLRETIEWAEQNNQRWVFTLQNAAKSGFDDRTTLSDLCDIDWHAVKAKRWIDCKDGKQAEFLLEDKFPWTLVRRIGVLSKKIHHIASSAIRENDHSPLIEVKRGWYYD